MLRLSQNFKTKALIRCGVGLFLMAVVSAFPLAGLAQDLPASEATRPDLEVPKKLQNVTIVEKLGTVLPAREMLFSRTPGGQALSLDKHLNPGLPTLLTLNYYQCTALCSLQLNGLVDGLKKLDYLPGRDFNLLSVSFDARNSASLAQMKEKNYLESLGRPGAAWTFLVGEQKSIDQITDAVGFQYKYDPETDQFAHTAAIFFLSPDFKVMRYLYGLQYSPRDMKFALLDASQGRMGSTLEKLILRCFHFDELAGKYTPIAMNSMRVAGILFSLCLLILVVALFRKEKALRREEYAQ
ncbi:MAG: SCO family protein [Betaproteobacteria bacterium]|nr:SCO family protein [Betaproteobacteria bacterium]